MTMTAVPADPMSINLILQLAGGAVLPRCLHAVANLGIADALGEIPLSADALAAATATDAGALGRALRLLAAHGVFTLTDGTFSHSPASRLLRTDHPQSMRPLAQMFGLMVFWRMLGDLEHSIRTGRPVFEDGPWPQLLQDPEASRIFDASMTAKAHGQVAGVIDAYDFSGARTIGDIGGGRGHLLRGILDKFPAATGVLFDQPHVVDQVEPSDKLRIQAGDFFVGGLPACDIYILMEVIHDWDDERAQQILKQVRASATAGARVLLIEALISEGNVPSWPVTLDLWMLAISGKQRTLEEYTSLYEDTGFRFTRAIATQAGVTIVEGIAV